MELVLEQVPELQDWWRGTKNVGGSLHSQSIDLAYEILDHSEADAIRLLKMVAPGIEMLLDKHDEGDEISLGFVDVLVAESAERGLNRAAIRDALGPIARQHWKSLEAYRGNFGERGPAA